MCAACFGSASVRNLPLLSLYDWTGGEKTVQPKKCLLPIPGRCKILKNATCPGGTVSTRSSSTVPLNLIFPGEEKTDPLKYVPCSGETICTKSSSTVPLNLIFPGEEKTDPLKYVRPVPAKLSVRYLPLLFL